MTMQKHAVVAGMLIGLGVIINTQAANPVLGAALFSFGLLTIILLQLPLYTGQIGFIQQKKITDLIQILLFNFFGIAFVIGLKTLINPDFQMTLWNNAILKFQKGNLNMLIDGFFCGMLIHFAVKCKDKLLTIMAIMIFILTGAQHCIADFPYLCIHWSTTHLIKFLIVVMGNSLGAIFLENMLKIQGENKK